MAVVNGYKVLDTTPFDVADKKTNKCNDRETNAILRGLVDLDFYKGYVVQINKRNMGKYIENL